MQIKKVLLTGLRILGVCLLFAVCIVIGGALSGLDRVAQQGRPAQASSQTPLQTEPGAQAAPKRRRERSRPPIISLFPFSLFPFALESWCLI